MLITQSQKTRTLRKLLTRRRCPYTNGSLLTTSTNEMGMLVGEDGEETEEGGWDDPGGSGIR